MKIIFAQNNTILCMENKTSVTDKKLVKTSQIDLCVMTLSEYRFIFSFKFLIKYQQLKI